MMTRAEITEALVDVLAQLLAAEEALRMAASKARDLAAAVEDRDAEFAAGLRRLADHVGEVHPDAVNAPALENARWLCSELLVDQRSGREPAPAGAAS